jgi:hypothetical protein
MSSWRPTHNHNSTLSRANRILELDIAMKKRELPNKKIKFVEYKTPECTDTAVILVFFNPASSIRIQQNILYVKHQLERAKIPIFIGEMAFHNEPSLFEESPSTFIFRSTSYMFYKEHLINLVIVKPAVRVFQKYVILDADIIFDDINWVDKISSALNTYDIIQPYEYACKLTKQFTVEDVLYSICKKEKEGHPGYAWAFRRDWYDRIGGLYEHAVIGGGDTCLVYKIGTSNISISNIYSRELERCTIKTKIGFIPGTIYHLPHGTFIKRQYTTRMSDLENTLKSLQISSLSDAVEEIEGILEWKQNCKDVMNKTLLQFFQNREDDNFD